VEHRGIGYVLAIDDTIVELQCFNLGIKDVQAFMNTTKTSLVAGGKQLVSYRIWFQDKDGELSGGMMPGDNGDDIIMTENASNAHLEALRAQNPSC